MMSILSIGCMLALCGFLVRLLVRRPRQLPLPPGPPADPLVGHIRFLPGENTRAAVFHEWLQQYGDVISLRLPGRAIILLGSEQAASDLLEKRSAIYSDRSRFAFFDAIGWGDALVFARYGPSHTHQRKLFQDALGKNTVSQYSAIQERETNVLLKGLVDSPRDYERHVQRFSGGIISDISYGHRIESFDDPFFSLAERLGQMVHDGGSPSLLDIHPIFRFLPSWAPGASFINIIKESKPLIHALMFEGYERVQEQMKEGTARLSFTSKHLEAMYRGEYGTEEHRTLRLAASMLFAAGFETTWHSMTIFLACMLLYPEVQRKAQEEIDRVVGRDRLPDLNDREHLPYVQCVVHEVMRWQPVIPTGLPHEVMVDDVYNGMFIPKGSVILANTRSLTWDERKFHEPKLFKPERFLPKPEGAGEIFPGNAVFGWGRRVCSGRFLAEGSSWLAAARILAVLTIQPARDAGGREIDPGVTFSNTMICQADPFKCDIHPRDEKAHRLILDAEA